MASLRSQAEEREAKDEAEERPQKTLYDSFRSSALRGSSTVNLKLRTRSKLVGKFISVNCAEGLRLRAELRCRRREEKSKECVRFSVAYRLKFKIIHLKIEFKIQMLFCLKFIIIFFV